MHRFGHYQSSSQCKRLSKYNIRTTIQNSRTKVDSKHNMGKCTQIHHTGQDHWVTSVQTETNETYILDNLLEKLTVSQEIQLSQIYSHGKKRLLVKMPEIH